MLEELKRLNGDTMLYSVDSEEFKSFGRIIRDINTDEITAVAEKIERPESGSLYSPSEEAFEALDISNRISERFFGTLPTQVGYCHGHSNYLNACEWHSSSEINIAVTPLVLILGHVWDIENGKIDSSSFRAFYLPKGICVEVYATTLHFCPCEVEKSGFGCVVALPKNTNTPLDFEASDPLLFRKNKWIIAHDENRALIDRGVKAGISGKNIKIIY